jgi:flagellin
MRINNANSVWMQAAMSASDKSTSKSLQKLATALRINQASDDAAGLSLSESLRSQIRDSQMSQRNASDGMAMLQIADAGTQQISESLQRMRELAIQSANGTLNDKDRKAIQDEYAQLQQQISGVAQGTTYNGQALLTGGPSGMSFQVAGSGGGSVISYSTGTDLSATLDVGKIDSAASAQKALASIDKVFQSVMGVRSGIGATMNRLDATSTNLGNAIPNLTDAESRIRDTDFANEIAQLAKSQILGQSSMAMMAQANQMPSGIMNLLRSA